MPLKILFQSSDFVAVEKPAKFFSHPPTSENSYYNAKFDCLKILRDQLGFYLYPVHRLDFETSGVLMYALSKDSAADINNLFCQKKIKKTYIGVLRGWLEECLVDIPLKSQDIKGNFKDSKTLFQPLSMIEMNYSNTRYATSRFTLCKIEPQEGRFRQIRRHAKMIGHPLVGDKTYGDRVHNQYFENHLKIPGLLLRAQVLQFEINGQNYLIQGHFRHRWHQVFDLFGICPWVNTRHFCRSEQLELSSIS